jgi:uncharacterized protein YigE (DUF2233 family)
MFLPKFFVSLGSFLFFVVANTEAEWTQTESRTEPSFVPGLIHRHVVLSDGATEATLELAEFSPKSARLRLLDNPNGRSLRQAASPDDTGAGVNGGYFDLNFAPLGLRVIDGKTLSPLSRGKLLSGIVSYSGSKIQILRTNEFDRNRRVTTAIQCGPFLIDHGAAVPGLDRIHSARRTFVALTKSGEAILGFCSDASLAELPQILAGMTDARIERALNLDGGSSSAFWFKRKDGTIFSISEQKSVRDFLTVTAR